PRSGLSVYEKWRTRVEQYAGMQRRSAAREGGADRPLPMSALGSGSDYSAFYQHAGIPAMDISSTGEYGVYHSIYDDFDWMKHFGDPEFAYHVMMARIAGRIVMRTCRRSITANTPRRWSACWGICAPPRAPRAPGTRACWI